KVDACVLSIQGQPAANESGDVVHHGLDAAELRQPARHGCVAACEWAQVLLVVRVGQAAHVEDEVGIARNPAFVGEGFEGKHYRGAVGLDEIAYPGPQLSRGDVGGVD